MGAIGDLIRVVGALNLNPEEARKAAMMLGIKVKPEPAKEK
jgi:hypothetical protein